MGTLANFIPPRLRSNLAPEAAGAWPRIVFGDLHGVPARTSLITVPSGPRTSLLQRYRGNLRINPFSSNPPSSPTGKTGRGSPAPVLEGGGGGAGARAGAGTERESQPLNNKVTTARLLTEARSGRRRPLAPGLTPRRSGLGHRPGRSLGIGGGRRRRTNPYF